MDNEKEIEAAIGRITVQIEALELKRKQWQVELHAARLATDAKLPTATITTRSGTRQVVIVRRTAATIYTRKAGERYGEQAWRATKHRPDQWHEHPAKRGYSSDYPTLSVNPVKEGVNG